MHICILFILFNGGGWVTPGCYTTGVMIEPHDVVFVQHLPPEYINVVYESPRYYYNHYRPYRRHVVRWRNYRYNRHHHRQGMRSLSRDRRHYRSHRYNTHRHNHRHRAHRHKNRQNRRVTRHRHRRYRRNARF
jgi:hypothetical protein